MSTTLFYVVRARDAAGNIDANTVEASATTPAVGDDTAPSFGGVATATPVGSTSVSLTWQAAADDVADAAAIVYRVYAAESPGGQDFSFPDLETAPGVLDALVSGLQKDTTYHFVVRAVDPSGNEDGNTVEVTATTGSAVSFSAQVQPVLDASCASQACHGGPFPAQDLDLRAGVAYGQLVGVASTQCAGRTRVTPSDPGASYLVNKLMGVDMCLGTQMPKTGSVSAADIQQIVDWISEGALEN